jgi:hypothetical protein
LENVSCNVGRVPKGYRFDLRALAVGQHYGVPQDGTIAVFPQLKKKYPRIFVMNFLRKLFGLLACKGNVFGVKIINYKL